MKLITEEINNVNIITEQRGGKKSLYIEGVFLQGDIKNRNNRVYPFPILESEVKRYNDSYVKQGRAMGELGHPCFNSSAKILTVKNGFKFIKECQVGELVYTLNPNTKELEENPVITTVNELHTGKVYIIQNRGIKTTVTPDHKFLVYGRNHTDHKFVTAQEIYDDFQNINSLSKWYIPKASLGLSKESPEYFEIPGCDDIKSKKFEYYKEPLKLNFKAFSAFLGIYLAEGCTKKHKNGSYQINITQNEGVKADEIRIILSELGLEWSERIKQRENKHIIFSCYERRLGQYLFQFGNCYNKYVPNEFIENLNSESSQLFLDAFVLGDGRGKSGSCDVFTVSKQLRDNIAHIASIAGIGVHVYQQEPNSDYIFDEHIIKAENKSTLYFCKFLNTKGVYLDRRFVTITEQDYNENVYCVTVKHSNFIVEHEGYTYFTGNCGPTINLDRVSHKIVSLHQEGKNFIGKAKILESTPMGSIAKSLLDEGVKLGVSSRAVGSLIPHREGFNVVGEDLYISTAADIVADPSAPDAFVEGIFEGAEWVYNKFTKEWVMEDIKNNIEKLYQTRQVNEAALLREFNNYLNSF